MIDRHRDAEAVGAPQFFVLVIIIGIRLFIFRVFLSIFVRFFILQETGCKSDDRVALFKEVILKLPSR